LKESVDRKVSEKLRRSGIFVEKVVPKGTEVRRTEIFRISESNIPPLQGLFNFYNIIGSYKYAAPTGLEHSDSKLFDLLRRFDNF